MAESQVPYAYDQPALAAITASLSRQRFETYLTKARNDENYAYGLYLYNARLAKSLLFPLSVTEVTLRNAVDEALVSAHGANWHLDLAGQRRGLTKESLNVLDRAFLRTRSSDRGKLIAELTFDFWSNLFRAEYGDLWRTKANVIFPGLVRGEGRAEIQPLVRAINGIRNRVAHHEPLLDVNIPDIMNKMIRLTELRCPVTASWMRHHSTVNLVMRSKPNQIGSAPQTFATRADPNIRVVGDAVRLDELCQADALTCVAFVCVVDGQVMGAFTHRQMMEFVASKAILAGGLVDMSDHTVAHMLASAGINSGWTVMDSSTPLSQVIDCLKQPQTRIIVGMAAEGPSGVILRAHRRY